MNTIRFNLILDQLKNNELTELSLSEENLTTEQVSSLSDVLKTNTSLKKLNLSTTQLNAADGKYISLALAANKTLEKLDLSNNSIGDLGARHFAETLKLNNTLSWLDLWQNGIQADGINELTHVILNLNNSIKCINLHDNSGNYELVQQVDDCLLKRRTQGAFFTPTCATEAKLLEEKTHPFLCMTNY